MDCFPAEGIDCLQICLLMLARELLRDQWQPPRSPKAGERGSWIVMASACDVLGSFLNTT